MTDGIFQLNASQEHYLDDPERWKGWLTDHEMCRRQGRSTALAHLLIRRAWASPGTWFPVLDHHPERHAHMHLLSLVLGLIETSGLARFMECRHHQIGRGRAILRVRPETLGT